MELPVYAAISFRKYRLAFTIHYAAGYLIIPRPFRSAMMQSDQPSFPPRAAHAGFLAVTVALFLGAMLAEFLAGLTNVSISLLLHGRFDGFAFRLGLAVAVVAMVAAWRGWPTTLPALPTGRAVVLAAAAVFAVIVGCQFFLGLGFRLSADEYMTWEVGKTFLNGRLTGELPPEWRPFAFAIHPLFTFFFDDAQFTLPSYRPGTAALFALFESFGLGMWMNPTMTAASVVLVAAVARQIWPQDREAPVIAALLLATSSQVIVMGGALYAMPVHLAFNLAWLWLHLRDARWSHGLAPVVGVLAGGLHQYHVHPLFAAPYLIALVAARRWRLAAYYGAVYVPGYLVWFFWHDLVARFAGLHTVTAFSPPPGTFDFLAYAIDNYVRALGFRDAIFLASNYLRFIVWNSLALVPLCLAAAWAGKTMPRPVRLAMWGVVATLALHVLVFQDQGHGWGYRYLHPLLGNIALLAVHGWVSLRRAGEQPGARTLTAFALALMIGSTALMPVHVLNTIAVYRPWAEGRDYIRSLDAEVVIVEDPHIYFGVDFVKNDPFLRDRPVILARRNLSLEQIAQLCATKRVAIVGPPVLQPFGIDYHKSFAPPPTTCPPKPAIGPVGRHGPDTVRDAPAG